MQQNIVEGVSDCAISAEMCLKLIGVARGSVRELREDYGDFNIYWVWWEWMILMCGCNFALSNRCLTQNTRNYEHNLSFRYSFCNGFAARQHDS